MARAPAAFVQTVEEHRNRLHRVLAPGASRKLKELYDEANSSLTSKLRRALRAKRGDTMTAYQHRVMLAQVRQGQAMTSRRMAGALNPLSKKAQDQALKGLIKDVSRLNKRFTGADITLPIEEAARFKGVMDARKTSLLRMHEQSMAKWGANVVLKTENQLALSLATGENTYEAIERIEETIDGEWWQGERIVRTELAWAHNATLADGMEESAKEIPELKQRWEEHCDDSGAPLDDRVWVDSIAMHGQVASPGDMFTMPATAPFPDARGDTDVPDRLVGLSWAFPPNRPNDRSVLSPWMSDWGVPGWRYRGGSRVPL